MNPGRLRQKWCCYFFDVLEMIPVEFWVTFEILYEIAVFGAGFGDGICPTNVLEATGRGRWVSEFSNFTVQVRRYPNNWKGNSSSQLPLQGICYTPEI